MSMYTFDPNTIWYSADKKSFMILSSSDVELFTQKVVQEHGGIVKKGTNITLSATYKIMFDFVVIKNNPCVLIRLLGSGAYGKVYEGYDIKRKKKVAVKSQPSYLSDVITKQAAVTKLNGIGLTDMGANIGPSFLSDKNGYFILPLADSCFHNWIVQKVVSGQEKLIIVALIKIAQDLQKLHDQRQVHMDLKTDNVLIVNDVAYLSDFGKVEKEGSVIRSANDDYKSYPQCAPEYFTSVSKNPLYIVSHTFDLFSYGYMLKAVSRVLRNRKYKAELVSISSYVHRMTPKNRKSLSEMVTYLNKIA